MLFRHFLVAKRYPVFIWCSLLLQLARDRNAEISTPFDFNAQLDMALLFAHFLLQFHCRFMYFNWVSLRTFGFQLIC
jgi:hypothetical protein